MHAAAAPTAVMPLAPTGRGGRCGIAFPHGITGGWPQGADLVPGALRPGARVPALARIAYGPRTVAVAGGRVVDEAHGVLSAYNRHGKVVWHTPLGDGAGLDTPSVALHTVGSDIVVLVTPDRQPATGYVVGVDAATGRVHLPVPVPVPGLAVTGDVTCAAATLYVISDTEPAPGHTVATAHGVRVGTQAVSSPLCPRAAAGWPGVGCS